VLTILTFDIDDITQQDFQLRVCTVGGCASGVACWPQQRSQLLPVSATWECCVSPCENSGKRTCTIFESAVTTGCHSSGAWNLKSSRDFAFGSRDCLLILLFFLKTLISTCDEALLALQQVAVRW
jgi:hypothetical protein